MLLIEQQEKCPACKEPASTVAKSANLGTCPDLEQL